MNRISKIIEIADNNHEDEMDSWYEGPTDEVKRIASTFDESLWNEFIQSAAIEKPDMWRVFIAHSFIDDEPYLGKSQELLISQALLCRGVHEANMIIQYMDNYNWENVNATLRQKIYLKVRELSALIPAINDGLTFQDIISAIDKQAI